MTPIPRFRRLALSLLCLGIAALPACDLFDRGPTPEQVRAALAAGAAGVISGSGIVERVARGEDVSGFVGEMKAATL